MGVHGGRSRPPRRHLLALLPERPPCCLGLKQKANAGEDIITEMFLDDRAYAAVNVTDYVNDSQRPA
eukprot:7480272-Heterocapsa_arctica.AAC.1